MNSRTRIVLILAAFLSPCLSYGRVEVTLSGGASVSLLEGVDAANSSFSLNSNLNFSGSIKVFASLSQYFDIGFVGAGRQLKFDPPAGTVLQNNGTILVAGGLGLRFHTDRFSLFLSGRYSEYLNVPSASGARIIFQSSPGFTSVLNAELKIVNGKNFETGLGAEGGLVLPVTNTGYNLGLDATGSLFVGLFGFLRLEGYFRYFSITSQTLGQSEIEFGGRLQLVGSADSRGLTRGSKAY